MVELVDTVVLGATGFGCTGSSPVTYKEWENSKEII